MSLHPYGAVGSPPFSLSHGISDSELTSFVVFCFSNEKLLFRYPQENPFVIYAPPTSTAGAQGSNSVASKAAGSGALVSSAGATGSSSSTAVSQPTVSVPSQVISSNSNAGSVTNRMNGNEISPRFSSGGGGAGSTNPNLSNNNNNNNTSMGSGGRNTFSSGNGSPTSAASPVGLPHSKSAMLLDGGYNSSSTGMSTHSGTAAPGTPGLTRDGGATFGSTAVPGGAGGSAGGGLPLSGTGGAGGAHHNQSNSNNAPPAPAGTRTRMQQLRHAKSSMSVSDGTFDAGLTVHPSSSGAGGNSSGRVEDTAVGGTRPPPPPPSGGGNRRLRRYAGAPASSVAHPASSGGNSNYAAATPALMPHTATVTSTAVSNTAANGGGSGSGAVPTANCAVADNVATYQNVWLRLKAEAEETEEAHNCVGIPAATLAHLVRSFTSSTSIQIDNILFFVFPLPLEPTSRRARHPTEARTKNRHRRSRKGQKDRELKRVGKKKKRRTTRRQRSSMPFSGDDDDNENAEDDDDDEEEEDLEEPMDFFSPEGSLDHYAASSYSSVSSSSSVSLLSVSKTGSLSSASAGSSMTSSSFCSSSTLTSEESERGGSYSSHSSRSRSSSGDDHGSTVSAFVSSSSTSSAESNNSGRRDVEEFLEEDGDEDDDDDVDDDVNDNPVKPSSPSPSRKQRTSSMKQKKTNTTRSTSGTGRRTGHAMLLIATDDVDTDDDALTKFLQCFVNAWMREERRSQYVSSQLSKVERLIEKWRRRLHRADPALQPPPNVGAGGAGVSGSAQVSSVPASNTPPVKQSHGDIRQRGQTSSHSSGVVGSSSPSARPSGPNLANVSLTAPPRRANKNVTLSSGQTVLNTPGARAVLPSGMATVPGVSHTQSHHSSSVSSVSSTHSSSSSQHHDVENGSANKHPSRGRGPSARGVTASPQRYTHGRRMDSPTQKSKSLAKAENRMDASRSKTRKKMFEWILNRHHLTLPSEMVTLVRIINYWNTHLRHIPPSKLKLLLSNNNGPILGNTSGPDSRHHRRRHHHRSTPQSMMDQELGNANKHGHGYHFLPDFIFVNKVIRLPLTYLTGAPPPSQSPLLFNSQFDPRCGVRLVDNHFPERLHKEYVSLVGPYSPLLPLDEARTCFQSLQHPRSLGALYRGLQMLLWTKMAQRHAQLYMQKQALGSGGASSPSSSTSSSISGAPSPSLSTHACYQAVAEEAATTDFLVLGLIEFLRMRRVLQVDSLITVTLTHADVLPASVVAANFQKRLNKVEESIAAMLSFVSQQRRNTPTTTTSTSTTGTSTTAQTPPVTESLAPKISGSSLLTGSSASALASLEVPMYRNKSDAIREGNAIKAPQQRPLPSLGAPSQLVLEMSMGLHQSWYTFSSGRPTPPPSTPLGGGGVASPIPVPQSRSHPSQHGTAISAMSSPSPSHPAQGGSGHGQQQQVRVGATFSSAMPSMLCSPTSSSAAASHLPLVGPSMSSSIMTSNAAAVGEFLNTVSGMPATPGGVPSSALHYSTVGGSAAQTPNPTSGTPPTMTPVVSPPTLFSSVSEGAYSSSCGVQMVKLNGGNGGLAAVQQQQQQHLTGGSTPPMIRHHHSSQPSPLNIGPAVGKACPTQSRAGTAGGASFHGATGTKKLSLTVSCVWGTACPLCENLLQHPTWWSVGMGSSSAIASAERRNSCLSSPSDGAGSFVHSPAPKRHQSLVTEEAPARWDGTSAAQVKLRFPSLDPHVHHFNDPQLVYPPAHSGGGGPSGPIPYPVVDFATGNSNFFKCNDISEEEDERLAAMRPWFLKPELYVRRDAKHAVSAYQVYQRLCGMTADEPLVEYDEEEEGRRGVGRGVEHSSRKQQQKTTNNNNVRSPSFNVNDGPLAAFPSSFSVDQDIWSSQAHSVPFSSPSASVTFYPSCSGTRSPRLPGAAASWRPMQRSSSRHRFQPTITVTHGAPSASIVAPGHYTWDQGGLLTTEMVASEAAEWLREFAHTITERLELGVEQAAIIANTAAVLRYAESAMVSYEREREQSVKATAASIPSVSVPVNDASSNVTTASSPEAITSHGVSPLDIPDSTPEARMTHVDDTDHSRENVEEENAPPPTPPTTIMKAFTDTGPPTTAPVSAGTVSPISPSMFTRHSSMETPVTTGMTRLPSGSVATTTYSPTSLSTGALLHHLENSKVTSSSRSVPSGHALGIGVEPGKGATTSSSLPSGSSAGHPAQSSAPSSFYSPSSVPPPRGIVTFSVEKPLVGAHTDNAVTSPLHNDDGWKQLADSANIHERGISSAHSNGKSGLLEDSAPDLKDGEEVDKRSCGTLPRPLSPLDGLATTKGVLSDNPQTALGSVLLSETLVTTNVGSLPPPPPSVSSQDNVESLFSANNKEHTVTTRYTRRQLKDRGKYMPQVVGQNSVLLFTSPLTSLPPEKAPIVVVHVTPTHTDFKKKESPVKRLYAERTNGEERTHDAEVLGGRVVDAERKGDGKVRRPKRVVGANEEGLAKYHRNTPGSPSLQPPTFLAGGRLKSLLRYLHPYPSWGSLFYKMRSTPATRELPMHVLLQFVMHHLVVFLWTSKSQSGYSVNGSNIGCDAAGVFSSPVFPGGLQRNVWVTGSDVNSMSGPYGVSAYGSATTSSRVQPHCGVDVEAILRQLERNLRRLPILLSRLLTVRDQAAMGWSSHRLKRAFKDQQKQSVNQSAPSLLVPQGGPAVGGRSSTSFPGFAASDATVTGVFFPEPMGLNGGGDDADGCSAPVTEKTNKKHESGSGWNLILDPDNTSRENIEQKWIASQSQRPSHSRSRNRQPNNGGVEEAAAGPPLSCGTGKPSFSTPITRIEVDNPTSSNTEHNTKVLGVAANSSVIEIVSLLDVQLMEAYELYDKMALLPLLMPYAGCSVGFPSIPTGPAMYSPQGSGSATLPNQNPYGVSSGTLFSSPSTQPFHHTPPGNSNNHFPDALAPNQNLTVPSVRLLLHTVVNEFSDVFLVGGQPCLDN